VLAAAARDRPWAFAVLTSTIAFLDRSKLLHGHVLLVPRVHIATLLELPDALCGPLVRNARRIAAALEVTLAAEGLFLAINTRISQSVPLFARAMVWMRTPYASEAAMAETAAKIRSALA
jgi:histidine triad (HIT) family protein